MEIKSYLIEENAKLIYDTEELDAWQDQVQLLGLEKQAALMSPDKSPVPFPVMTEAEREIYGKVLDRHSDYKSFDGEVIPLRILSLISLSEKEKYFDEIQIWHSRTVKDPLVIGKRYDSDADREEKRSWNMTYYLIGAWGEKIKLAVNLLEGWNDYMLTQIKDQMEWNIKEQNQKYTKFKYQLSSVTTSKK